jgi:hypothetical protein
VVCVAVGLVLAGLEGDGLDTAPPGDVGVVTEPGVVAVAGTVPFAGVVALAWAGDVDGPGETAPGELVCGVVMPPPVPVVGVMGWPVVGLGDGFSPLAPPPPVSVTTTTTTDVISATMLPPINPSRRSVWLSRGGVPGSVEVDVVGISWRWCSSRTGMPGMIVL